MQRVIMSTVSPDLVHDGQNDVVINCCNWIEQHALEEPGIWRTAGNPVFIQKLEVFGNSRMAFFTCANPDPDDNPDPGSYPDPSPDLDPDPGPKPDLNTSPNPKPLTLTLALTLNPTLPLTVTRMLTLMPSSHLTVWA